MMGSRWVVGVVNLTVFLCGILAVPTVEADNLRVCADPNNPPYSDSSGGGFENKIAQLFADQLGYGLEFTWFPQRMGFIRNTLRAKIENEDRYKCDYVMGIPAGYELALTTKPYYRSVYALVVATNRGWDDIETPDDLANIPPNRQKKLRIAMFDRGPGTTWIVRNGFVEYGVPYQTMSGDASVNVSQIMENDFKKGIIDMAILWGPVAGYLVTRGNPGTFKVMPLKSQDGMRFDFPIAMGVRYGDKSRMEQLNRLIDKNSDAIQSLLQLYHVPLVTEKGG